jgi:hypothetical protein
MTRQVVFWTAVLLTVACGGAAGILSLAYGAELPPPLAQFQAHLLEIFVAGALAIFGLLQSPGGGR